MPMTRDQLQALRRAIDSALIPVAQAHGCRSLTLSSCTYSPEGSFTFKLEGVSIDGVDKEASRYNSLRRYQHPELPELGATLANYGGRTYIITGCNSTGTKIRATHNGATYLLPIAAVLKHVLLKGVK